MGKEGKLRRWVLRLVISPHSKSHKRSHDALLMSSGIHYHVNQQVGNYCLASTLSCLEGYVALEPIQTGHVEVYEDRAQQRSEAARRGHLAGGKSQTILNGHVALQKSTPRGHVAVYVGEGEAEERFLVPISYLSDGHLEELLRRSEREFGYQHTAGLRIPCSPSEFHHTLTLIHTHRSLHAPCIPFPRTVPNTLGALGYTGQGDSVQHHELLI